MCLGVICLHAFSIAAVFSFLLVIITIFSPNFSSGILSIKNVIPFKE